jgi:hypothetical protein
VDRQQLTAEALQWLHSIEKSIAALILKMQAKNAAQFTPFLAPFFGVMQALLQRGDTEPRVLISAMNFMHHVLTAPAYRYTTHVTPH